MDTVLLILVSLNITLAIVVAIKATKKYFIEPMPDVPRLNGNEILWLMRVRFRRREKAGERRDREDATPLDDDDPAFGPFDFS